MTVNLPSASSSNEREITLDTKTPYGVKFSALYKQSYAYKSTHSRWIIILRNLQQSLKMNKSKIVSEFGTEALVDMDGVTKQIEIIMQDIRENKSMTPIHSQLHDVVLWNRALAIAESESCIRYYKAAFLLVECYLYRRLASIMESSNFLKVYDIFRQRKTFAFDSAIGACIGLGNYTTNLIKNDLTGNRLKDGFLKLIQFVLWNTDLSETLGLTDSRTSPDELLARTASKILANDSLKIWNCLTTSESESRIVAIICSSAGYELFADFCMADFILSYELCDVVIFYVKSFPWFITDAIIYDFHWIINKISSSKDVTLAALGQKWQQYCESRQWIPRTEYFFTMPYCYDQMHVVDEKLFREMKKTKLLIFKSDLNYRKLLLDINWPPTTSFEKASNGFRPSAICAIRSIHSELLCGLQESDYKELFLHHREGLLNGEYGVIQFASKTDL